MYDPSYFFEREQFLASLRGRAEESDCPIWQEFVEELAETYEGIVEVERELSETGTGRRRSRLLKTKARMLQCMQTALNLS